jgi:hypothetical protein
MTVFYFQNVSIRMIYATQCRNIALLANSHFAKNMPLNRMLCIVFGYLTNQLGENNESPPQKQ